MSIRKHPRSMAPRTRALSREFAGYLNAHGAVGPRVYAASVPAAPASVSQPAPRVDYLDVLKRYTRLTGVQHYQLGYIESLKLRMRCVEIAARLNRFLENPQ